MQQCELKELLRRAKVAGILPDDFDAEIGDDVASYAEEIALRLRLPEEKMYELLALEYTLDYLPLQAMTKMEIPAEYRGEEMLAVFRREGFAPVEKTASGALVAVVYPFPSDIELIVQDILECPVQIVLCTDRVLGDILKNSVDVGEETEFDSEESYFIGSESEEDAFPGLYGASAADVLWQDEPGENGGNQEESRSMTGFVEDISLVDMLQMIGNTNKSATITINSEKYGDIYIFCRDGQIIHCVTEYGAGEEAFYKIIDVAKGPFEIKTGPVDVEQTIHARLDALLMEGFRRKDEEKRDENDSQGQLA